MKLRELMEKKEIKNWKLVGKRARIPNSKLHEVQRWVRLSSLRRRS
jgi:hypothetical protein